MSRISTLTSFRNAYENIQNNHSKALKISDLLASENKFSSFSDLYYGNDIREISNIAKLNDDAEVYKQSITVARFKLEKIKNVLDSIIDTAQDAVNQLWMYKSIKDLSMTDDYVKAMVRYYIENIKNDLNVKSDGKYLFAGGKFDTKPVADTLLSSEFREDEWSYYEGDDSIPMFQIAEDIQLSYGFNANNKSFSKLIYGLNLVYYDVENFDSIIDAAEIITQAISELIAMRHELMNTYSIFDRYENDWDEKQKLLYDQYNNIEDTYHLSLPELMADFATTEVVLNASESMFPKLIATNMIDII